MLMMKIDMGIENRCRKQVESAMYKIDPSIEESETETRGNGGSFGRGEND
jgi:hypothetical protein